MPGDRPPAWQRGLAARIVVPAGVHPAAVGAIAGEGGTILPVGGCYQDAVALAARLVMVRRGTADPGDGVACKGGVVGDRPLEL